MNLNVQIDKESHARVYRQVADQIRQLVATGVLKPGERLPTERELSDSLNLARGTINKAYDDLKRDRVIKVIPGSGSYVFNENDVPRSERKELAAAAIREMLIKLDGLHFTIPEVHAMLDLVAANLDQSQRKAMIATIDCNPESLAVIAEQFSDYPDIELKMFLLDDVLKYAEPEAIFEDFNFIITTMNHYEQVTAAIPSLKENVLKAVVSLSQNTIIMVATIQQGSKIGMIVRSTIFRDLVLPLLESMNINPAIVSIAFEDDVIKLDKLLIEMDVLIIPHLLLQNNPRLTKQLHYFKSRGGKVIDFQQQIEQGSIFYIEEWIERVLSGNEPQNNARSQMNNQKG